MRTSILSPLANAGLDARYGNERGNEMEGGRGNDLLYGLGGNDELDGESGNDTLFGGAGRDEIDGGSGNDRLDGGSGNDTLEGGRGNDIMTGGSGRDLFEFDRGDGRDTITDFRNGQDRIELDDFGTAAVQAVIDGARQVGNDVVLTLSPNDSITLQNFRLSDLDFSDFAGVRAPVTPPPARGRDINGTSGDDILAGGAGNDDIEGGRGNDLISGGGGHDEIDGGRGRDTLRGGAGNDDLDGDSGRDRLSGGRGNDTLDGGRGNDLLSGGLGSDVFVFDRGDGHDTITDFTNGQDRIELDDFAFWQIQSVIDGARQEGDDVVLSISADTSITIRNFQVTQLDIGDFLL